MIHFITERIIEGANHGGSGPCRSGIAAFYCIINAEREREKKRFQLRQEKAVNHANRE